MASFGKYRQLDAVMFAHRNGVFFVSIDIPVPFSTGSL